MLLERLYDDDLAQASYLIGCEASGEMLVLDPLRDPRRYLAAAKRHGMRISGVAETHIHADYLSGSRELARLTGAPLYLSSQGGPQWQYSFEGERIGDGDEITLGKVCLRALHTPGHTPEHLSFLLTDGATASEPGYLLSGDFVFSGDLGRPDLLDEAAGAKDSRFEGARQLFESLQKRFLTLPDYIQVLPGHGAGSACGKALGAVPSTTVGYERRFAWWAGFLDRGDESGFVSELLSGQPDVPSYFGRMKRLNRQGPPLLDHSPELTRFEPEELVGRLGQRAVLIDTRPGAVYLADGVAGALHVPAGGRFTTYASYALDPEADRREIYLLASDESAANEFRRKLALIGVDNVAGFITQPGDLERRSVPSLPPHQLGELDDALLLDVRSRAEFDDGHVPGSSRHHLGRLARESSLLPEDRPIVVYCHSGARAAIAVSILLDAGFERVLPLEGSYAGWSARNHEQDAEQRA